MIGPLQLLLLKKRFDMWWGGLTRRVFRYQGQDIHYWRGGKGQTIMLVHGLGGSTLQDFAGLACVLSRHYEIISIDLPGYGLSYRSNLPQSIASHRDFLLHFAETLGIPQAHWLGNSMGGWICMDLAVRHPTRVGRLILFATAGLEFVYPPPEIFLPKNEDDMKKLVSHLLFDPPELPRAFIEDWKKFMIGRAGAIRRMLDSMLTRADLMEGRTGGIAAPTLILWGEEDRIIPVECAHRLRDQIPHNRTVLFPRCGHLIQQTHFKEVVAEVRGWLEAG
ncbi:MAG: alpha/beta fold hydrolase [Verrucomicrobiae bacterium]|nr:alpha/beta fold hydrolase [Verrucomicrobiae bacterium]